ncbi:FAD-dependent oxidoreductase [Oryzobacter terrae]|uniref:FAD-dependent oxidoreductase n=1 Tax=Oryzobacter terrae TaxID=1620385 RepID=UPI00366DD738
MRRVVVVGHGMVGSRFTELLVEADPAVHVTVLGKEPVAAYNRVLLSSVVAGSKSPEVLGLAGPAHPRVRVLTGVTATAVDRRRMVVVDDLGDEHPYDELVLATGSAARVPPIQGVAYDEGLVEGVFVLKDMTDATGIVEAAGRSRRAVVLGAGVLGVEVATGLATRGLSVRIVHLADRLMERQLGWEASQVAINSLERLGITTHVGASVVGVTTRRGRLEGIRFADGVEAAADLFVMCCGTVPETMLARRSGLTVDRGVVVTDALASPDDPHVHAVGDCAQPPSGGTGLVAQGWQQAAALVATLTTGATAPGTAPGSTTHDVVRVKASGMSMVSMGASGDVDRDDPRFRVLSLKDPERGRYVEVVVAGGLLAGATCIGDAEVAATLSALYTRSLPVPDDPALLMVRALAGGGAAAAARRPEELEDGDRVCTCNSVSAGRIREAVRGGCTSAAEVSAATRASTGCGDCRGVVEALVAAGPGPHGTPPTRRHDTTTDLQDQTLVRSTS